MSRNCHIIYYGIRIHWYYSHSKRSTVALFPYLPNFQINSPYYYYLFRQPVNNCISKRPLVLCPDQIYWHQIPFYSMDHWEGKIQLIYCPTEGIIAYIFTKALPFAKVKHFANELGLVTVWGSVGDQTATKTKRIVAHCLSPLGACFQGYCCQQKSLNMAVLLYIPQFSLSLRYWG